VTDERMSLAGTVRSAQHSILNAPNPLADLSPRIVAVSGGGETGVVFNLMAALSQPDSGPLDGPSPVPGMFKQGKGRGFALHVSKVRIQSNHTPLAEEASPTPKSEKPHLNPPLGPRRMSGNQRPEPRLPMPRIPKIRNPRTRMTKCRSSFETGSVSQAAIRMEWNRIE
jgi:hypothetical protein